MLEDDQQDGDATMVDDQDSQEPSQLPPSSPPPLPTYDGDLVEDEESSAGGELTRELREQRRAQFGQALLAADCPACKATAPTIQGSEAAGARCVKCGWGMEIGPLEELGRGFGLHGSVCLPSLNRAKSCFRNATRTK